MSYQNLQNCPHTEVISGFDSMIDRFTRSLVKQIDSYRETQSRRVLYRCYRRFTADQLRDIGMGNPQDQLRVLGRYI
jgi:hypothetical protein